MDLDQLFDPPTPPTSGATVASQVDRYLSDLLASTGATGDEFDRQVATHVAATLRNRWWGLFAC